MSERLNDFTESNPTSRKLFDEAVTVLAGGVVHENRYVAPFPIYVDRAKGSRKWDVDGHEYIDYSMGSASMLLGHAHPDVIAAIAEQAPKGTFYGNCTPLEVEWAGLVQQLIPSAELVRFVGSGTEATLLAIRVARAYTGKSKIVRFEGHYHGWHDYVAVGMQLPLNEAPSLGLLPGSIAATVVVPANDLARVEATLKSDLDIAAVILEASGASWGTVPLAPGFHAELRRLTQQYGVVLIFDEIITGFRHSPGGVQKLVGVTPDLTTLAKVVTGGLPGGAVVGRAEVMRVLDPRSEFGGRRPGAIHRGTFNSLAPSAARSTYRQYASRAALDAASHLDLFEQPVSRRGSRSPAADELGRLHERAQLRLGDGGRRDRRVGEGGEAAVGREEHALGAEERDRAPGPRGDLVHRLDRVLLLVDHPHAQAHAARQIGQHVELAGARGGELEEQRADGGRGQERQQRTIVTRQGRPLVARPVAAADVKGQPLARQPGGDGGEQLLGEGQLALGARPSR